MTGLAGQATMAAGSEPSISHWWSCGGEGVWGQPITGPQGQTDLMGPQGPLWKQQDLERRLGISRPLQPPSRYQLLAPLPPPIC